MELGVLLGDSGEWLAFYLGVFPASLLHALVGLALVRAIMLVAKPEAFEFRKIPNRCAADL